MIVLLIDRLLEMALTHISLTVVLAIVLAVIAALDSRFPDSIARTTTFVGAMFLAGRHLGPKLAELLVAKVGGLVPLVTSIAGAVP